MLAKSVAQYLFIIAILGLTIATSPATLQAQSSVITPNPDAQPLRKIWELGGRMGDRMGSGFGSVGDINGDSLDDFAVSESRQALWHVFYGRRGSALSTTPVWTFDSSGAVLSYPIHGNFLGTGRQMVGFHQSTTELSNGRTIYYYHLYLFRTDSFRLDTLNPLVLNLGAMNPRIQSTPLEINVFDLDRDGYDELVLYFNHIRRYDTIIDAHPQVWIYRGGPAFQVDSPTVIIRDAEEQDDYGFQIHIGRFDDDPYPDLLYGFRRPTDRTSKLVIYFGRDGSPWNWTEPDRIVNVGELAALDCNGDSILDLALPTLEGNTLIFLSGTGKSLRDRSLMRSDADLEFEHGSDPGTVGFLSDSGRRFAMLDLRNQLFHMIFSGGPPGPDPAYDTYSSELFGPPFLHPLGDVTGDGWDDLMTGYFGYDNYNGIARVFAGGPYIPRDPSSGVRTVATDERSDAIHLWPNPVTTQLHIAWRGDLKRMPRVFMVHDIRGSEVARGTVESWRGEAIWNCTDVPAGNYLLSIYDYTNALMTTTPITKY